jgi:glycine hydroxymethyltransferase
MDEVAGLIDRVLTTAEPGTTKSGAPSKASHVLDAKVADEISQRATDLVAGFPLYPEIDLG